MDKKAKKRLSTAQQRLQELRRRLAGAKRQDDEPGEVRRLQEELAALEEEVEKLRSS